MSNRFDELLLQNSPIGFAYCKLLNNSDEIIGDYEIIEHNAAFEKMLCLSYETLKGKTAFEIFPKIINIKTGRLRTLSDAILDCDTSEFVQYSDALKKMLKIILYKPDKDLLVIQLIDISTHKDEDTNEKKLVKMYKTLLESLPYPAMLINGNDKIVLATNVVALQMGVKVGDHCWRDFMKAEFLSPEDEQKIKDFPEIVPSYLGVRCTFCKGDICLREDPNQREPLLEAFGGTWDTSWIRCSRENFLHYAINVSEKVLLEKLLVEEQSRLENIIEGARAGTWDWNIETGEIKINSRWAEMLGYTIEELAPVTYQSVAKLIHSEDLKKSDKAVRLAFERLSDWVDVDIRMIHKNRTWTWINYRGKVSRWTDEGYPLTVSGVNIDITNRKLAEEKLVESERRLQEAQKISKIGNWELDLKTKEIWASPEAFDVYGIISADNYTSLDVLRARVDKKHQKLFKSALTNLITKNEKYDIEFKISNPITNEEHFIHSMAVLEKNAVGKAVKVIGLSQDITEQKMREEKFIHLSYYDQLTGLYNRRFYEEELKRLDTLRNLPITIVTCDVNGLKLVNDSFGHKLGDELIKKVAKILKKGCRNDDIVARHGGDEFAIILYKTSASVAEKIVKRIRKLALIEEVEALDISIAIGYDTKNSQEENIQVVAKNAEDHMYRNKLSESSDVRRKTIDLIINTLYKNNNMEMLHSKRVSKLCEMIANSSLLEIIDKNKLCTAGLLHDIGKIGIDEQILNKKEKLNYEEYTEIMRHSEIGYQILSSVNEFSEIAQFALEHHERWDGNGYPRGLKGEEISIEARIIAVASAFDIMLCERGYGIIYSEIEALAEIENCSGTQFDPRIVTAFVKEISKQARSQPLHEV